MKGFTLTEMLITLSVGLLLITALLKVYLWQSDIHHKIEDMVFLDHNGVLAVHILKNVNKFEAFSVEDKELRYKKNKNDHPEPIITGVLNMEQKSKIYTVKLKAPHGMEASYSA